MLERQTLRLMPWSWTTVADLPALAAPAWVRNIHADGDGAALGFVRVVQGPSWLGLGPRCLEVCETDDACLLMTLEHGWLGLGHWRVVDAERCCVGSVVGAQLLDECRLRFATTWIDGPHRKTIRARAGNVHARLELGDEGGMLVMFADEVDANPFLRMVLLGGAILQQPQPGSSGSRP